MTSAGIAGLPSAVFLLPRSSTDGGQSRWNANKSRTPTPGYLRMNMCTLANTVIAKRDFKRCLRWCFGDNLSVFRHHLVLDFRLHLGLIETASAMNEFLVRGIRDDIPFVCRCQDREHWAHLPR